MLKLVIPGVESWNSATNEFLYADETVIELEHSLVSLSKWEAKWGKPFLSPEPKTTEETLSYIRIMTLTPDVSPEVYYRLSNDNITAVNEYLEAKMTATWFNDRAPKKPNGRRETVTAEIIYHWMISFQIPFECREWHLNQLITLIKVTNEKNASADKKQNKMSPREIAQRNRELNAQRQAAYGTSG